MASLLLRRPRHPLPDPLPRHWLGGDAFRTQVFNALSFSFPCGEQFFIDSVRRVSGQIDDPALHAQVQGFIGQEAIHRKVHGDFNRALQAQGLFNWLKRLIGWRIRRTRHFQPIHHLAVTAAYEHFTALLGEGLLLHPHWLDGAEPACQAMWLWHAIEETEHKAVALQVYRAVGGSEGWRRLWFVYVSVWFCLEMPWQVLSNLHRDGSLWQWATWRSAWRLLCGPGGVFGVLWRGWPRYLRRGYQPESGEAEQRAAQWLTGPGTEWVAPAHPGR